MKKLTDLKRTLDNLEVYEINLQEALQKNNISLAKKVISKEYLKGTIQERFALTFTEKVTINKIKGDLEVTNNAKQKVLLELLNLVTVEKQETNENFNKILDIFENKLSYKNIYFETHVVNDIFIQYSFLIKGNQKIVSFFRTENCFYFYYFDLSTPSVHSDFNLNVLFKKLDNELRD